VKRLLTAPSQKVELYLHNPQPEKILEKKRVGDPGKVKEKLTDDQTRSSNLKRIPSPRERKTKRRKPRAKLPIGRVSTKPVKNGGGPRELLMTSL